MLQVLLIVLKWLILLILAVLGLFLVLLLSLLLIPFGIESRAKKEDVYQADIHITWLWRLLVADLVFLPQKKLMMFKLLRWKIYTYEIKAERETERETEREAAPAEIPKQHAKREEKKKVEEKRLSLSELLGQITEAKEQFSLKALGEILRFLRNLFSSLRLRLKGKARIGLSDPADTGMLLGLFYAITGALSLDNFLLHPNWDELSLEGNIELFARIWLVEVTLIVLKTLLAKPIRGIWWPYAKQAINPFNRAKPQTT